MHAWNYNTKQTTDKTRTIICATQLAVGLFLKILKN